ncbi:SsgA family sporulation/cell division regulator [Streptomyces tateyamensis]|uniref:SsgA family sporulation/cell division regulator n=1 Tax=Streptomyces tateyamensis TaxID=565073 RepID=UPI0015E8E490|nr:SsgA family sporulation/cell division regulator [Streptomyces tateyamensis]
MTGPGPEEGPLPGLDGLVPPQRAAGAVCTAYVLLEAIISPLLSIPVPARLRYRSREPYTVYLDSHIDLPEPVTWALSREILLGGLTAPTGLGDVSVFPGTGGEADSVFVSLRGRDTTALLRARADVLHAFLRWTACVVPPGLESEHFDVDTLLGRLREKDDG